MITLREISEPIDRFIPEFESVLREQMKSNVLLLDTVLRYIVKQRGKRVRPLLVLLSAAVCGNVGKRTYIGASMVEILHTASLVHDDVVDESNTRRGMASINAIWKNKIAVLVGDYMLSRGLLIAVKNEEFDFLRVTSSAVQRMSEGELLQIQKSRQLDIDEETYFRIIGDKTASLISSCCEIGAVSASNRDEHHAALRTYGELVGCVFQIRDDIFDYTSSGGLIGKPVGNDVKEKKLTLPLIRAFQQAPKKESTSILKRIKGEPKKHEIQEIVAFVKKYDGLIYAERKAQDLIAQAKATLSVFDDSPAKTSLLNFADFSLQRTT
jgi:octaprenyl-diphosphate synthase